MDPVTLHRAVAFARAYPSPPEPGLSWVHYRELVGIRDPAERDWYAQRALSEGWTGRALVEAIRQERYQQPGAVASRAAARQLKRPTEATHVYKAWVKRVIDGDTLLLHVDLGFSVIKEQRLRLAAIDAPPLKTPAGRESWRAALDRMGRCEFVVVKTNKVDVHGRYVGHVFYATREMSPAQVFEKGRYLNQELLSEGFAKAV
jgi:endonuclease YncB( thermonuclease family)